MTIDCVIPDEEPVLAGHYSAAHLETTAAAATAFIMRAEDPRGYEIIVPRKIRPVSYAGCGLSIG